MQIELYEYILFVLISVVQKDTWNNFDRNAFIWKNWYQFVQQKRQNFVLLQTFFESSVFCTSWFISAVCKLCKSQTIISTVRKQHKSPLKSCNNDMRMYREFNTSFVHAKTYWQWKCKIWDKKIKGRFIMLRSCILKFG